MLYVSQLPPNSISFADVGQCQTAAHFGALVLGSDIDGRQMRGKREKFVSVSLDFHSLPPV
jgi:hypothetical protein